MVSASVKQGSAFRSDIHRLRGIAILMIVAAHCITFVKWDSHASTLFLVMDLFDNSTLTFMFISGFLFHHNAADYRYAKYLKTKWRNVLVPYLIAAAPGIAFVMLHDTEHIQALNLQGSSKLVQTAYLYLYGGAQLNYALWFIPVLCAYYLASPLLLQFIKRPRLYWALLLLLPLSILMHRPTYSHGHNLGLAVYFLSAFVGGMFCSQFKAQVEPLIDKYFALLCALTVALIVWHLEFSQHHGKYTTPSLSLFNRGGNWIDWLFVQKAVMTLSLWGFTRRLQSLRLPTLDYIADVSFTIYFLHLYAIYMLLYALPQQRQVEVSGAWFIAVLLLAVLLPSAVAACVRKIAPRWSRMLVGS
jgi:peptidoglycan/LPS O-acetylase OafA/YrhL